MSVMSQDIAGPVPAGPRRFDTLRTIFKRPATVIAAIVILIFMMVAALAPMLLRDLDRHQAHLEELRQQRRP